jgi:hypothetical protein
MLVKSVKKCEAAKLEVDHAARVFPNNPDFARMQPQVDEVLRLARAALAKFDAVNNNDNG